MESGRGDNRGEEGKSKITIGKEREGKGDVQLKVEIGHLQKRDGERERGKLREVGIHYFLQWVVKVATGLHSDSSSTLVVLIRRSYIVLGRSPLMETEV